MRLNELINTLKIEYIGIFLILFAIFYSPLDFLINDPDSGFFVSGANRILYFNDIPQVDFKSQYGPLLFYLTSFFMSITSSIRGFVVLCFCGYFFSYLFFYKSSLFITKSKFISLSITIAAIFFIGPFYKFFNFLLPISLVYIAFHFKDFERNVVIIFFAFITALAFLYRLDFSIYCAFFVLLFLYSNFNLRAILAFFIIFMLFCLPWLLIINLSYGLDNYFFELYRYFTEYPQSFSFPFSSLSFISKLNYLFFFSIPLSLILIKNKFHHIDQLIILFSLILLVPCLIRSDISHLFQSSFLSFLLLSFFFNPSFNDYHQKFYRLIFFFPLIIIYLNNDNLRQLNFFSLRAPLNIYSFTLIPNKSDALLNQKLIVKIKQCSKPFDRVAVFPYQPQLSFFSDRISGGLSMDVSSKYMNSTQDQLQIYSSLNSQGVKLILIDDSFVIQGENFRSFSTVLNKKIESSFIKLGSIESYSFYYNLSEGNYYPSCF